MKRKPTREEKELIANANLNWKNWLVDARKEDNITIVLVNKKTGKLRPIWK